MCREVQVFGPVTGLTAALTGTTHSRNFRAGPAVGERPRRTLTWPGRPIRITRVTPVQAPPGRWVRVAAPMDAGGRQSGRAKGWSEARGLGGYGRGLGGYGAAGRGLVV